MTKEIFEFTKEAGGWVYDEAKTKVVVYKRKVKWFSVWLAGAFLVSLIMIIAGNAFGSDQLVNTAKFVLVIGGALALILALPPLIGLYLAYRYSQIAKGIIIFICGLFLCYFVVAAYFLFLPVEEQPGLAAVGVMALVSLFLSYLVLGAKVNPKYIIAWRWAVLVAAISLLIFPGLKTAGAHFIGKANKWLISLEKPPLKIPRRLRIDLSNIDLAIFYDPNGKPVIFYCLPEYGKYEFFDSDVFCPSHGRKLKPITDAVIKHWRQLLEIEARVEKEKELAAKEGQSATQSPTEKPPAPLEKTNQGEPQPSEVPKPPTPEEENLPEWKKKAQETLKRRVGAVLIFGKLHPSGWVFN